MRVSVGGCAVPSVDLADETYVAVAPEVLAGRLADPSLLAEWFPALRFDVFMDRAEKGIRWSITGEVEGSMEVWLEPMAAGTLVHWYLRGEPETTREAVVRRYVDMLNARMFAFKDEAEQRATAP
jgi:carbon monoxide dehydrogenase subunit G